MEEACFTNNTIPVPKTKFGNIEEAEISYNNLAILKKDVLCFKILVDDTSRMKIAHTLKRTITPNYYKL